MTSTKTDATLPERQQQVLDLIAQGKPNREIGRDLHLTEATIKQYVSNLLSRLGARDRAHAVALGYQRGLLTIEPREPTW